MKTREERIVIVNKIINKISSYDRSFFKDLRSNKVATIIEKKGRLYYKSELYGIEIYLHTKYGIQPYKFPHGGTLWGLIKDFKHYIMTGEYSNHKNGYGGLYCQHWGYSKESMKEIQDYAKELGYLKEGVCP